MKTISDKHIKWIQAQEGDNGKITLPAGLSGTFIWNGKSIALKEGINQI